jgi:hypothetical protein
LNDAIFEIGLPHKEAEKWRSLPASQKLSKGYRELFKAAGWEFGKSVINVIHCPCCPKDANPNPELLDTKSALENLLGSDEDGLASTFEDFNL